jgi:hypothetical protein
MIALRIDDYSPFDRPKSSFSSRRRVDKSEALPTVACCRSSRTFVQ